MWRGEVQDLLSQISQLQAENKRLLKTPRLKEPPIHEEEPEKKEGGLSAAQNWRKIDLFLYIFLYVMIQNMFACQWESLYGYLSIV